MTRRTGSTKRKRLTEEQVQEMLRMRRQGQSVKAIAEAIGCHRQTVRLRLQERHGDILADEVRKQLLIDELRRHVDDLAQFADSLAGYLRVPTSCKDEGDAAAVLTALWGKERWAIRRNKLLFESLQEHTGKKGWWVAFEEWQETWNTCKRARDEVRREACEVVWNLISQRAALKEGVERQSRKERDIEMIADDVLWVVWWAIVDDIPVEKVKFQIEQNRVEVATGRSTYYASKYKLSEVSLGPDMLVVCKLSFETLYQSFSDKGIPEMLDTMKEKIDKISDSLNPSILRPQILRTRCALCPA